MRIFIALFSGETADLSVSAKKMYNGMNMKRTIKPPNIEARNIVLLGNKMMSSTKKLIETEIINQQTSSA